MVHQQWQIMQGVSHDNGQLWSTRNFTVKLQLQAPSSGGVEGWRGKGGEGRVQQQLGVMVWKEQGGRHTEDRAQGLVGRKCTADLPHPCC
jgi:hypothetical protein